METWTLLRKKNKYSFLIVQIKQIINVYAM